MPATIRHLACQVNGSPLHVEKTLYVDNYTFDGQYHDIENRVDIIK
jgi:hypothetical protein